MRSTPVINVPSPVREARIVVAPASAASKDMTFLGLLARATHLQQQMLDFLKLGFIRQVLAGQHVSPQFCSAHQKEHLERIAQRTAWPPETLPEKRRISVEQWRATWPRRDQRIPGAAGGLGAPLSQSRSRSSRRLCLPG